MNKIRNFLNSTRKELLLQIIFIIFAILIPDEIIQVIVLGVGIMIVSFMLQLEPNKNSFFMIETNGRLFFLSKWVFVHGLIYFSLSYAWVAGTEYFLGSYLPFIILMFISVALLMLPSKIFLGGVSSYFIAWFWGLWAPLLFNSTSLDFDIHISGVFIYLLLAIALIWEFINATKLVLFLISNVVGGAVFSYILSLALQAGIPSNLQPVVLVFEFINNDYWIIYLIVASLSSTIITGLAYMAFIEDDPDAKFQLQ